ncbi:restriction endonuclease subunit S [Naasia lichenicola]|nr:restriction endonuclease subunit S [Naasia lichenicola]
MTELRSITTGIYDCEHKTAPQAAIGHPLIRTPNIGRGRFLLTGVQRVSDDTYSQWTRRAVPRGGDLILAREAPVGGVALIPDGLNPVLGQRTVLIRPHHTKVSAHFLNYVLNGPEVQSTFAGQAGGSTVPHLNLSDIRALRFSSLPDLKTQRKIATILSAYDDLIENNQRRTAILEQALRASFDHWFDWDTAADLAQAIGQRVGDVVTDVRQSVLPGSVDEGTPYLGLEHLPRRQLTIEEAGDPRSVSSTKLRFEKGDVLFGKIRPYFHKVALAPFAGIASSDIIILRPRLLRQSAFVAALLSSDKLVAHAVATSQGTKMPRANWDVVAQLMLPAHSAKRVSEFEDLMAPKLRTLETLASMNRSLNSQRSLLLPKLVAGQIELADINVDASRVEERELAWQQTGIANQGGL